MTFKNEGYALNSMRPNFKIPFHRTLRFKLFFSYCVLLLLTVVATLLVHTHAMSKFFRSFASQDIRQFARQTKSDVESYLRENPSGDIEHFLFDVQGGTPYRLRFIRFQSRAERDFTLTKEESQAILAGGLIEGAVNGRIKRRKGRGPKLGHPQRPAPHRFVAIGVEAEGKMTGALILFDRRPKFSFRMHRLLNSVWLSLAFVVTFAIIAAYLLSRHLTGPIRRMESVVQDFSSGRLDARTGLQRGDEIGVLARGFDHMAAQIESNAATRTRLLSDVSHELGTPVTTIRATIEALQDNLVKPEQRDTLLMSTLNQLAHLSGIVNDVTELARFETGQISVRPDRVQASVAAFRAVEATAAMARKMDVQVELSAGDESLMVIGDLNRLIQVLQNLVMNAIHHNPSGTKVNVSWILEGDKVVFTVSDDGPPIPDDEVAQIFDRFYKVSKSRTRNESSSGIGLAIVRRILHLHNADIELNQYAGEKSFRFQLPTAP